MLFRMCFFSLCLMFIFFFFFNDTATTEIYTLSLHDALPISPEKALKLKEFFSELMQKQEKEQKALRSEEHTSELQSQFHLVCRLLLEKKKTSIHAMTDLLGQQIIKLLIERELQTYNHA